MGPSDQIQLVGVIAATILGIIALLVSLQANRTSAAAEQLAREAYFSERRIAVVSTLIKSEDGSEYLSLNPAGSDQTINNVTLFFPRKIREKPYAVAAGELRLSAVVLEYALRDYWDTLTPSKADHAVVRERASIPVGVSVHGYTKGDSVVTQGIYDLYCRYIRYYDKPSHVKLLGLSLNNWTASDGDLQGEVDHLLVEYESASAALQQASDVP
jgi:hypothetical protein